MEPHLPNGQMGPWTNEKHVHFLNSMEASFVRTMLENNSRVIRLNLHLQPDRSESTLDLKSHQRLTSDIAGTRTRMDGRTYERTRTISSQRYDPSQDQVVPQLGNTIGE